MTQANEKANVAWTAGEKPTRPPIRSRASRIVTRAPFWTRISAQRRPEKPAPIMPTWGLVDMERRGESFQASKGDLWDWGLARVYLVPVLFCNPDLGRLSCEREISWRIAVVDRRRGTPVGGWLAEVGSMGRRRRSLGHFVPLI
jgi:hypothetical protein